VPAETQDPDGEHGMKETLVFVRHPDWQDYPPTPVLVRSDGFLKLPAHPAPEVSRRWKPLGEFSAYVQDAVKAAGVLDAPVGVSARKGLPASGFLLGLLFGLLLAKKLDPYVP
jgi:hypothetical protein